MKRMKQILSLLLVAAMSLTAFAFAETDGAVTEPDAPVEERMPEASEEDAPLQQSEAEPGAGVDLELEAPAQTEPAEAPAVKVEPETETPFEARVAQIGETLLQALVIGKPEAELEYQWQALDSVAYQAALMAGEMPLVDAQWLNISGATGDVLDPASAMGEDYMNYSYRCIVCANEALAVSDAFGFERLRIQEGADDTDTLMTASTAEECAHEYDGMSWESDASGHWRVCRKCGAEL